MKAGLEQQSPGGSNDMNEQLAVPNVLCSSCRRVCGEVETIMANEAIVYESWKKEFQHCSGFEELEASAQNGCHLCVLLLYSIALDMERVPSRSCDLLKRPTIVKFSSPRGTQAGSRLTLHFKDWQNRPQPSGRYLRLINRPPFPTIINEQSDFLDARLSLSTASGGVLKLARQWLSQCQKSHSSCGNSSQRTSSPPTRLLDVQKQGNKPTIRLHISNSDENLQYLTLSHCWGELNIFTLTSETMQKMVEGFDLDDLPKTFQDAVQVCRELGFRYLWIDALCIMQDSVKDWKIESSKMGSVYENSICTIAALFGKNSHSGCFTERNPLQHYPCQISETQDPGLFVSSPHVYVDCMADSGFHQPHPLAAPRALHTRAWVVQERLLSPRTLYFGSRIISWECREAECSEWQTQLTLLKFPDAFPGSKKHFQVFHQQLKPLESNQDLAAFYKGWGTFLNLYTNGRLTLKGDRLFALAGVVDLIHQSTGFSTNFGLWKELLHFEILWYRDSYREEDQCIQRPKEFRAPSWSWASQEGPVISIKFDQPFEFVTENIRCEEPPRPQISSTALGHRYLCLSGPLLFLEKPVLKVNILNSWMLDSHAHTTYFVPDQPILKDRMARSFFLLLITHCDNGNDSVDVGLVLSKIENGNFVRWGLFRDLFGIYGKARLFAEVEGLHDVVII